jgi:hypothetical protein
MLLVVVHVHLMLGSSRLAVQVSTFSGWLNFKQHKHHIICQLAVLR